MMSFTEIFSDAPNQARLIIAIIAGTLALTVVWINQWQNNKRARKEKIIEKIEEIYEQLLKTQFDITMVNGRYQKDISKQKLTELNKKQENEVKGDIEYLNITLEEITQNVRNIEMIAGLYFRDLKEYMNEFSIQYYTLLMFAREYGEKRVKLEDTNKETNNINSTTKNIHNKIEELLSKLRYIMEENMY